VSGHATTGSGGKPSRGEMTSFASAIHVVAQTSWHPSANRRRPSFGSSRSRRGLPQDLQHAYTGTAAHAMAMIRNLALAILRLTGHREITRTLQRIAADRTRILPILAVFPLPTQP
jgi:hypothetical protein